MKTTATIRTASPLVGWDVVKRRKHDSSMVETPDVWLWVQIKGIYYPYSVI